MKIPHITRIPRQNHLIRNISDNLRIFTRPDAIDGKHDSGVRSFGSLFEQLHQFLVLS